MGLESGRMPLTDRRSLGWFQIAVLLVVVALSAHAVRTRPETRLIGQAKVNAGTTLSAREDGPHRSWDMDLRLDQSVRPPGWPWILHEGKNPGEGYELHWLPEQRVLQVYRSGLSNFLLGSIQLLKQPARVSFQRRGGLLLVASDGLQVLRCLDPDGPPTNGPRSWGCSTSGTLGEATLTVQIEHPQIPLWASSPPHASDPVDANAQPLRTDGPFLAVGAALRARDGEASSAHAFGKAREQLGLRRGAADAEQPGRSLTPADRARLRLWLSLARIRGQLGAVDAGDVSAFQQVEEEIETLFTATDHDGTLRSGAPVPELPGIFMSLTEPLTRRACTIPSAALTQTPELVNASILAHRSRWISLLGRVTSRTLALASDSLSTADTSQLRLLLHAAGCLRSTDPEPLAHHDGSDGWTGAPLPLPLDAPPWLAARWRAFAGDDPGVDSFQPMGGGSSPVTVSIDLLAAYDDMDPVPAISLRHVTLDCITRRDRLLTLGLEAEVDRQRLEDEALRACDRPEVPPRERLLTRALIVLHLGDARPALLRPLREALEASGLVRTDPVGFAIDQLLVARYGTTVAGSAAQGTTLKAQIERFFPEYQVLMDGSPAASARIWRVRLPHAQALAVALSMQEVAGLQPSWALLERVPGFTLPLPLLARVRAPATTSGGAAIAPLAPGSTGSSVAP